MLALAKINRPKGFCFKRVLQFSELSDAAKEKAREWWRQSESELFDGLECMTDDFETIAEILGIRFETRSIPLMSGKTRQEARIWYSGFYSQGDGACFDARYSYAKGCAKKIRAYAPQDTLLHRIADELQAVQSSAFYRLKASTKHSGHYYHSGCMKVDVSRSDDKDVTSKQYDGIKSALRLFADWIYRQLKDDYEYRMSDESVDESITCNGYTFDKTGNCVN